MLPRLVTVLVLCCSPAIAAAGDSTWLWCKGTAERGAKPSATRTMFAASLHEHRGAGGDTRELAVTLVYGDHVSRGTIANAEVDKAGTLTTTSVLGKRAAVFAGKAKLDQAMTTFTLTGTIDASYGDGGGKSATVPFTAKLTCATLDDQTLAP
jgi:hypothetical protein